MKISLKLVFLMGISIYILVMLLISEGIDSLSLLEGGKSPGPKNVLPITVILTFSKEQDPEFHRTNLLLEKLEELEEIKGFGQVERYIVAVTCRHDLLSGASMKVGEELMGVNFASDSAVPIEMTCTQETEELDMFVDVVQRKVKTTLSLFLPMAFSVVQYDLFESHYRFCEDNDLGVIGAKIVNSKEGKILTVGTDILVRKENKTNPIILYSVFSGFPAGYARPYTNNLVAVASPGMLLRTKFLVKIVKQPPFFNVGTVVDLCAKMIMAGKRVMYHSGRNALESRGKFVPELVMSQGSISYFTSREFRNRKFRLSDERVAYDFGGGGCSGWFLECQAYSVFLQSQIRNLRIITGPDYCPGLSDYEVESLDSLRLSRTFGNLTFLISHKPPSRYPSSWMYERSGGYDGMFFIKGVPRYRIGRSMYETTRIPGSWLWRIEEDIDEVWVPSDFVASSFIDSGVASEKVVVVPETLDHYLYDPQITSPYDLPGGGDGFNFLSVFKWEKRKGPDILIRAFVSEFSERDSATLHLLTYKFGTNRNKTIIEMEIDRIIDEYGLRKSGLPRIEIITPENFILRSEMPGIYAAADAFVLPSRGEGWGLPMFEAMLMEKPTIASNHSGHLHFMNEQNSLLVKTKLVKVDPSDFDPSNYDPENMWGEPDIEHLRELMRYVYENPAEARELGKTARLDLIKRFNSDVVTEIIVKRLEEISKKIGKKRSNVQMRRERDRI